MVRRYLFLTLLLCSAFIGYSAQANTTTPSYTYTKLFYYSGGAAAKKSFYAHAASIDVFAPQYYFFDSTASLMNTVEPDVLSFARAHNIKVMPLVTNGAFSQASYKLILDDPVKQSEAITQLIDEAKAQGYWGWQIDFEQMDISYRDKFSIFMEHAYVAFQEAHLSLSVAVLAQISDNPSDYPKTLWQKTIGVYDYRALASSTDFITIMSYDDPYSSGPVVEYAWLQKVLTNTLAQVPKEKVSLGIPLYYWQWNDGSGKLVGIGGNTGIQNVLKKHKVVTLYDTQQQAPYIQYKSKGQSFTIWYENAKSIAKKIQLITKNKLYGFSAWALGLEQASVYTAIK